MIETRGSDWLSDNGGHCWCKIVRSASQLDLTGRGSYSMPTPFISLNQPLALAADHFLMVASEYLKAPNASQAKLDDEWEYKYILVETLDNKLQAVKLERMYKVVYAMVDNATGIIPYDRENYAMVNIQYMAAVYCATFYAGLFNKLPDLKRDTRPNPFAANTGVTRKIIRNIHPAATPGGSAVPMSVEPVATKPIPPIEKRCLRRAPIQDDPFYDDDESVT